MTSDYVSILAGEFFLRPEQVKAVIELLDAGNTIPFIARYRKEATGSLDDQLLREIAERLEHRRSLDKRRNEIEKAVAYVLAAMDRLEDEAYFELLYRLAGTLGQRKGIVYLNERDLKRVPADFEQRLAGKGVRATLSKTPDSSLKNGFLLKNGDIEDNMSFGSVMAEKREAVEDLINRELFKR